MVNKLLNSLHCAAVKSPGFGDHRRTTLEDIAILTGGRAITTVLETTELPGEEQFGVQLLKRALEAPVKQIAANAGFEGAMVLAHVMENYS